MKVHFKKIRLEKRHWVFLGLVAALCLTGIINMRLNSITGETQPIALKPSETPTQEQQSEEGGLCTTSCAYRAPAAPPATPSFPAIRSTMWTCGPS